MISPSGDGNYVYIHFPTLHPTSYSIEYRFKTPFPMFRDLWGSIDESEVGSGTETAAEDRQPVSESPEVTFNASISGKIKTPTRQFNLLYEDGRKETSDVFRALHRLFGLLLTRS
jgi:hypothetical protein